MKRKKENTERKEICILQRILFPAHVNPTGLLRLAEIGMISRGLRTGVPNPWAEDQ